MSSRRNLPRRRRRSWRLTALLTVAAFSLCWVLTAPVRADHLLPRETLDCSKNFPCPPALTERVQFWISVFRRWGRGTVVLHDARRPERVYAVVTGVDGCTRGGITGRARKAMRRSLLALAAEVKAGRVPTDSESRHLAALFPAAEFASAAAHAKSIRRAASRIRCQGGVRDSFEAGLKRYYHYRPMIEKVLRDSKLPPEIRYLPFVESSFNPAARSKAGAAGIWQIMPRTARVLGLRLDAALDERLDPEIATRAAARYFQRADKSLTATATARMPDITRAELNPFLITAYNYGVSGMRRAMRRVAPDFMAVLTRYRSPRFQTAVKNFYASFLAARHVAVGAERNSDVLVRPSPATDSVSVRLPHTVSVARVKAAFGVSEAQLRPRNRALTRFVWRGWRLIPGGYRLHLPLKAGGWGDELARLTALGAERLSADGNYTVRRGDTACGIAQAVGVGCRALIRANQLGPKALILIGQELFIPWRPSTGGGTSYAVRRGDTACAIARRFSVNCVALQRANQLRGRAVIYPGQRLTIPAPGRLVALPPVRTPIIAGEFDIVIGLPVATAIGAELERTFVSVLSAAGQFAAAVNPVAVAIGAEFVDFSLGDYVFAGDTPQRADEYSDDGEPVATAIGAGD